MRLPSILLALGTLAYAAVPQLPVLSPATAVDVRVKAVQWHPRGEALLYQREGTNGIGLGAFVAGQPEGKVLVHIPNGDAHEVRWFEGIPATIVIRYHPVTDGAEPETEISVHILDAKAQTARQAYLRRFPADQGVKVEVDPSPSLRHAIFRLRDASGIKHLVLPTSGPSLIGSGDLDHAVQQGYDGPVWTVDGTAVYNRPTEPKSHLRLAIELNALATQTKRQAQEVEREVAVASLLGSRLWVAKRPAPELGAPVMELVPGNGVLRPVRFRGEWPEGEAKVRSYVGVSVPASIRLGSSVERSQSLWLTPPEENLKEGVLVAANASKGWISPLNRGVAYIVDGALFFRTIGRR